MAGLPAACLYAALAYEQAVQWLGPIIGLLNQGHFNPTRVTVFGVPLGVGLLWSCYLIRTDADDKWRRLHWIYFCLFAFIMLSCYGPEELLLAVVGLHFLFHLSIHLAFEARKKQDALIAAPLTERPREKRTKLLEQYSGLAGFEETEADPTGTGDNPPI